MGQTVCITGTAVALIQRPLLGVTIAGVAKPKREDFNSPEEGTAIVICYQRQEGLDGRTGERAVTPGQRLVAGASEIADMLLVAARRIAGVAHRATIRAPAAKTTDLEKGVAMGGATWSQHTSAYNDQDTHNTTSEQHGDG
ncbi:hypothetical protein NDU88_006957 [Pleurodeles waltl]|uniref:Uncharacterized protein n=1 Tax=Pleurodeles waltl TaxID=8319 RepID=A0AAV7MFI8_PLEWA|nr:hypothetical protein NDU88_006957 [Pleurodeles waltl]